MQIAGSDAIEPQVTLKELLSRPEDFAARNISAENVRQAFIAICKKVSEQLMPKENTATAFVSTVLSVLRLANFDKKTIDEIQVYLLVVYPVSINVLFAEKVKALLKTALSGQ